MFRPEIAINGFSVRITSQRPCITPECKVYTIHSVHQCYVLGLIGECTASAGPASKRRQQICQPSILHLPLQLSDALISKPEVSPRFYKIYRCEHVTITQLSKQCVATTGRLTHLPLSRCQACAPQTQRP
jgi:hypothetical protein